MDGIDWEPHIGKLKSTVGKSQEHTDPTKYIPIIPPFYSCYIPIIFLGFSLGGPRFSPLNGCRLLPPEFRTT